MHNILTWLRTHKSGILSLALVLALLGGYLTLNRLAMQATDLRKGEVVRSFEANPQQWAQNPAELAAFRQALNASNLAAVAQLSAPQGALYYTLKSGAKASVRLPNCTGPHCASETLTQVERMSAEQGFSFVRIDADPRSTAEQALGLLAGLGPMVSLMLTMIVVVAVMVKLQSGGAGGAATLLQRPKLTFDDVIGNREAKAQLTRVAAFLKSPKDYTRIGARAPRGVLMVGPPGTGKTLLAQALAGQTKSSFISVDGSYFTSMFYGLGVSKVKALFELARKNAPTILFIDEVDGISKRTSSPDMRGADSESNRIINRILVEMDGFSDLHNVIVVAATNHESNVDEALRRPGRFDSLVRMTLPTVTERRDLFEMYANKVTRDPALDTSLLSRMTAGASPADIANLVNKAASTAAEAGAASVCTAHLVQAVETFRLGGEVSPVKELLTPHTRERLAYHEAGHALMAHWLGLGVVDHLTIEPRGEALGVTYVSRESEDPLYRESELTQRLAMMLAGREAELLVFGGTSSGAADDLKKATDLAFTMTGSLGFSAEFGVLSVAGVPRELIGPELQLRVLRSAQALLSQAQGTCKDLLERNRRQLEQLAQALLEADVLSGEPLQQLLGPKNAS